MAIKAEAKQRYRIMDVRFCVQTRKDADGRHRQFFVRLSGPKRFVTIDIYGNGEDGLEGLPAEFIEVVTEAVEAIQGIKGLPAMALQEQE